MREGDREALRTTFGVAASTYHVARPDYPEIIFRGIASVAGLGVGTRVLEVGAGTGKATIPLARSGATITAVELSPELAREAQRNLSDYPDVDVVVADVEAWARSAPAASYDLVVSATAWHWIDPSRRYGMAWRLLRSGGHLATWSAGHVVPDGGDTFFADIQKVYDEIGEGLPPGTPFLRPGELDTLESEMTASGLFDVVHVEHVDWELRYDADSYIALLDTFSGHIAMGPEKRAHLYGEIRRRLGERDVPELRRHWGAVLEIARRRDVRRADA